jgi:hypothetical protein
MPKVYAFDVDECLETSNGPVTVQMLRDLREQGHIVGLCGALCRFMDKTEDWHKVISFTLNFDFGYNNWYAAYGLHSHIPKQVWLHCFQHVTFPGAEEYVMVGNIYGEKNSLGHVCGSHDSEAAAAAGWRFIKEDDFARGVR